MALHLNIEDLLSARTVESDRIEYKQGWNPDAIYRSINQSQVRSRRYRNRRLGEFLKELELTECRATGIPTILKALKDNGSPEPRFYTDEDHTFFEIELFIHPAFIEKTPFSPDVSSIKWDFQGIDTILNQLFEYSADIVGGIAEGMANRAYNADNLLIEITDTLNEDVAGGIARGIARGIAGGIADNTFKVLDFARDASSRKDILIHLSLVNNANNFENHIQPLVSIGWLTMTIPDKPTSPNQKYQTTLKGRLIVKFLKLKKS
ncbi:MAG: ATP-binding protein [Sphaerochaetaceae bacterium]|nr:ATP-binding protein [Sphaerochaetaceae bacterium]